jgi:ribonucleotide reductase alpha subunit
MKPSCPKCQAGKCRHLDSEKNWKRANYTQAIALLKDEKLVWSNDMEAIRHLLADVFEEAKDLDKFDIMTLNYLAEKLIEEENDLAI